MEKEKTTPKNGEIWACIGDIDWNNSAEKQVSMWYIWHEDPQGPTIGIDSVQSANVIPVRPATNDEIRDFLGEIKEGQRGWLKFRSSSVFNYVTLDACDISEIKNDIATFRPTQFPPSELL